MGLGHDLSDLAVRPRGRPCSVLSPRGGVNRFFSNLKHYQYNINILYIQVQFETKTNTTLLFTVAANHIYLHRDNKKG